MVVYLGTDLFVIGLTGGIASGKSTVSQMLREKGAIILNADQVGHEVYRPGTGVWQQVVATFGQQVVGPGGEIDRRRLGQIVFSDAEALRRLNAITHPPMRAMMRHILDDLRAQGADIVVLEAALLIEADWLSLVDEVWVTVVPQEVAAQRLIGRNGLSPEQAMARIRSQLSNEERLRHAHVVIDTHCSLDMVQRKVDQLWQELTERLALSHGYGGVV